MNSRLAEPRGAARCALLGRGGGGLAAAEQAEAARSAARPSDQHAVAEVAQPVAGQEAERRPGPRRRRCRSAWGCCGRAALSTAKAANISPASDVDDAELDHAAPSCGGAAPAGGRTAAAARRGSAKAAMAVGMAHSDSCSGSTHDAAGRPGSPRSAAPSRWRRRCPRRRTARCCRWPRRWAAHRSWRSGPARPAVAALGGGLGHGRDQRPDHLRLAADARSGRARR